MRDIKDFYILGIPIETEIGLCEFIKVKEYPDFYGELQVIGMTREQIIYSYEKINKNKQYDEQIKLLKSLTHFEMVHGMSDVFDSYCRIFAKVFGNKEVFAYVNEQNFNYYRSLILKMNGIKEEKINPNPEIQRAIERSKRVKQQGKEKLEFADIVSSIVAFSGIPYREVNEMTLYEMYVTFYRIGQFKGYDTSTLFKTVSTEKIDVESWSKHIDLFEEEDKHFVSQDEFSKSTGSMFND